MNLLIGLRDDVNLLIILKTIRKACIIITINELTWLNWRAHWSINLAVGVCIVFWYCQLSLDNGTLCCVAPKHFSGVSSISGCFQVLFPFVGQWPRRREKEDCLHLFGIKSIDRSLFWQSTKETFYDFIPRDNICFSFLKFFSCTVSSRYIRILKTQLPHAGEINIPWYRKVTGHLFPSKPDKRGSCDEMHKFGLIFIQFR